MEKAIYEEVKSKDMYLTEAEMWKASEEGEFKKRPVISDTTIDTLELYNKYFQSQDGLDLNWKVIQWFPELQKNNKAIFLWVWFKTSNIIFPIDYLKVANICVSNFIMVTLLLLPSCISTLRM